MQSNKMDSRLYVFAPDDEVDQRLARILMAHDADEDHADKWANVWSDTVTSRSSQKLISMWSRFPCPPTTPPKVRRFLLVDLVAQFVVAEGRPGRDLSGFPLSEDELPENFNERVAALLMELGEDSLAAELRERPAQFWLAYYEGWAQATVQKTADFMPTMEPWMSELIAAAKGCIELDPDSGRYADVSYEGTTVELPDDYRFPIPGLALQFDLEAKTPRIWLLPTDFFKLGPLPLKLSVDSPEIRVDARRVVELFEHVSAVEYTEVESSLEYLILKVVGRYRGHAVELAVQWMLRDHWFNLPGR